MNPHGLKQKWDWKNLIKHQTLSLEEVNVLKINEDTGSTAHNITSYLFLAHDILFLQSVSRLL